MLNKVRRYITNPYYALGYDMIKKHPHWMSDKYYLSILWKMVMGYELDWKHPRTFNEKIQWLKLYDRNPLYSTLVDKYRVKQWVSDMVGEQYIIPTLGVYNSVEDIDLERLPNRFVLKCNHDSGSIVICKDKASFDLIAAKEKLGTAIKKDFYWEAREWPYKNVKRCIYAEEYLENSCSKSLPDYKFFAFNGEVKALFIATDRNRDDNETRFDFYDREFNHLCVTNGHPNADTPPQKPQRFNEMIQISQLLSKGIPQVRCDFFEVDGRVYLGEMTLYHWGGMVRFNPFDFDLTMGDWIKLPCDK